MSQPRRRDREDARRCSRISSVRWFANTVLGAVPTDGSAYELSKLISAMLLPLPPAVALAEAALTSTSPLEGRAVGPVC